MHAAYPAPLIYKRAGKTAQSRAPRAKQDSRENTAKTSGLPNCIETFVHFVVAMEQARYMLYSVFLLLRLTNNSLQFVLCSLAGVFWYVSLYVYYVLINLEVAEVTLNGKIDLHAPFGG